MAIDPRANPEDAIEQALLNAYAAHYTWEGPTEAEEHIMQAIAHLAYADSMWRVHSGGLE